MVTLRNLFARPDSPQSAGKIILWWEARRLHYNLIILVWALILAWALSVRLGWDYAWTLETLWFYLLFFQLPSNIWFTGGWIADLIVKKMLRLPARGFAPWALAIGILLSLLFYFAIFVHFLKNQND